MRICIAPVDIASYYAGLKQGFDEAGVEAWFFPFSCNPYSRYRPGARSTWLERLVFGAARSPMAARHHAIRWLTSCLLRLVVLIRVLCACDVFVFAGGMTFFRGLELPLLRFLRKRIIVVFNGSDSRPVWMSGLFIHGSQAISPGKAIAMLRRQRRMLRWLEFHAHACIAHPLSAHLHRLPFVNHLAIGHPCATPAELASTSAPPADATCPRPLRIVHAPSRPEHKGTTLIRLAVDSLRADGLGIEFIELIGRPNAEVISNLATCDMVIDELYSDIPLAGLGTEAAQAGKPAIVGGYGQDEIARFAAGTNLPTALYVHPAQVATILRQLANDPAARTRRGSEARNFVRTAWNPSAIAQRFLRIARGRTPRAWLVDPAGLRYWQGWGASEEQVRVFIAAIVRYRGVAALGIGHNPGLQRTLAAFADREPRR